MTKKATMTHSQREYAKGRVNEIAHKKQTLIGEKFAVKVTVKDLKKAIKAGTLKLRKDIKDSKELDDCTDFVSLFDFGVSNDPSSYRYNKKDTPAYDKAREKLELETLGIIDEIMLGDQDIALKALTKFEKFKV